MPDLGLDPIFQTYLLAIGGLLAGAGALLLALRLAGRDVSGPWRTYRGWLFMVPFVVASLAGGRVTVILGVALLSCGAFKEFARATGFYTDWWYTGFVYLAIGGLACLVLMVDPRTGDLGWYGTFMAAPAYAIGGILAIPILRNQTKGQLQKVALSILGFVYLGWMFGHLGFLANTDHLYGYLLYLVFAVELSDIAAFTFGRLFGRHPLRSEVSPNKTVEGALGALAVSMALPWALHFSFPHFEAVHLILAGLIVGVGGQLGDLTISFIKRDIGIKDMGSVIPGHGGILDRVDSLIYVAPLFFHMVRWFHGV